MPAIQRAGVVLVLLVGAFFVVHTGDQLPAESSVAAETSDPVEVAPAPAPKSCVGSRKQPGGPDPWGGCWPGPHNTGVPAGTALTSYSGDQTVSTRGAVVDGWDVDGCILVSALGVTIQNSRAHCVQVVSTARYCRAGERQAEKSVTECTVVAGASTGGRNLPRLTVRDSEIRCPGGLGESGVGDRNIVLVRVEITHCENGLSVDSFVKVKHSYVHDLYNASEGDPHTDGLQGLVGRSLKVVHNVFYAFSPDCTYPSDANCNGSSALTIGGQPDFPSVRHTTVRNNLFAGGSYTVYCPILDPKGFSLLDNRFSEVYSPKVGEYGPMDGCSGPGVTKRGNKRFHF